MKYIIHTAIVAIWASAINYTIICFERDGYDLLLVAIIFICGIMVCSQLFILLTEAEEIVCR